MGRSRFFPFITLVAALAAMLALPADAGSDRSPKKKRKKEAPAPKDPAADLAKILEEIRAAREDIRGLQESNEHLEDVVLGIRQVPVDPVVLGVTAGSEFVTFEDQYRRPFRRRYDFSSSNNRRNATQTAHSIAQCSGALWTYDADAVPERLEFVFYANRVLDASGHNINLSNTVEHDQPTYVRRNGLDIEYTVAGQRFTAVMHDTSAAARFDCLMSRAATHPQHLHAQLTSTPSYIAGDTDHDVRIFVTYALLDKV